MTQITNVVAVVPAAGVGSRMQADRPKQYLTLHGKTILEHTLAVLISHPAINQIVIALDPADPYFEQLPIASEPWLKRVDGGEERADSVLAAVAGLPEDCWALVHDAARPCLDHGDIDRLLEVTGRTDVAGGILATPVRDTMKRARTQTAIAQVLHTECRDNLWHALTPQLFNASQLKSALQKGLALGRNITDEASAMEFEGYEVALIDANPANIKITRPADLPLAAFYLSQQTAETP